jgi:hypothetical protein
MWAMGSDRVFSFFCPIWNTNNTANGVDRNASTPRTELQDSFVQMPNGTSTWWGIAVPNGTYSVQLTAGDPSSTNSVYKINVGGTLSGGTVTCGTLAINGTPTSTNLWFSNTVTATVTGGVLYVSNATGAINNKIDEIDVSQVLPGVNFANGFTSTAGLKLNGGTWVKQSGTALQLTNGGANEAASAFTTTRLDIAKFSTNFSFQLSSGSNTADGFTFTIQGVGPTALGSVGEALGYAPIANSVAVKFDLYNNRIGAKALTRSGCSPTESRPQSAASHR